MSKLKKIALLFFLFPIWLSAINYDVTFLGFKDKPTLDAIKSVSDLVQLKNRPPQTLNSLRYRASTDIEQMIKVMHASGYYDANITYDLEEKNSVIFVYIFISPGPRYVFRNINFYDANNNKIEVCDLTPEKIGLKLETPAITQRIINAEKILKYELATCGYPLAQILDKDVTVDLTEKSVYVNWHINTGPQCTFGQVMVSGLKDINIRLIEKKLRWEENEIYSQKQVIETQKDLLNTNLFSSVNIKHADEPNQNYALPMSINLIEAMHKYVSIGASYATVDGFGGSFEWGNRNFRSMGELLALSADISQRTYQGVATYKITDCLRKDQDYVLRLDALREKIPSVYLAFDYMAVSRFDRKFSNRTFGSLGIAGEYDIINHSANDGKFFLFSLPAYLKYTTTSHLLNPTDGFTIIYRPIPYINVKHRGDTFFRQLLSTEVYIPTEKSRTLVLAFRVQLGSIFGQSVYSMPMNKLFLGGSDDDLRGYKFRTVSPRDSQNRPIGGRSAIFVNIEPRFRVSKSFGFVPFMDLGTVSLKQYPDINHKWYKSVGFGFRYFSFFGPLRLDIGIPLDRRHGIDPRFRIYGNIGQTF